MGQHLLAPQLRGVRAGVRDDTTPLRIFHSMRKLV
jgi:hypothetical protein